jgi:hypothetical protein
VAGYCEKRNLENEVSLCFLDNEIYRKEYFNKNYFWFYHIPVLRAIDEASKCFE